MGYLAIGFVMWGGIQYMTAQGDPGKVARGKKTITNAVIGLIISMTASIISGAVSGIVSSAAADDGKNFFTAIFNKVFFWSGVVAVIMIIYGGIQYITSTGNPAGVAKAKTTILYSIIGLLVVIFAAAIINVVVGAIPE
jgi:cytochrome bd-type quinol oxidase subunit 2